MAWEKRRNGKAYYTRTRRVHGRRIREYLGAGPAAEWAAAEDARRRAERQAVRDARRRELARLREVDDAQRPFEEAVHGAVRATLVAAGYHLHARGEWRRTRHGRDESQPGAGPRAG
jgi:hypothetical protein